MCALDGRHEILFAVNWQAWEKSSAIPHQPAEEQAVGGRFGFAFPGFFGCLSVPLASESFVPKPSEAGLEANFDLEAQFAIEASFEIGQRFQVAFVQRFEMADLADYSRLSASAELV